MIPASGASTRDASGQLVRRAIPAWGTAGIAEAGGRGIKRVGGKGIKTLDQLRTTIHGRSDMDQDDLSSKTADITSRTMETVIRRGVPKTISGGASTVKESAKAAAILHHGSLHAVNSVRSMFSKVRSTRTSATRVARHAATASRQTADGALHAAGAVNDAVRFVAARVTALLASVASIPVMLVVAVVTVIVAVIASILAWIPGMAGESDVSFTNVPSRYVQVVTRAGHVCDTVTSPVIAAQIEQESNWNPNARSSAGAQGIAQFMPGTWASRGKDGDGDGRSDAMDPTDAIWSQGNYMCALADQIGSALVAGRVSGDLLDLTLASYNAGIGNVYAAHGIPKIGETMRYVRSIRTLMAKYVSVGGKGSNVGSLRPPLTMNPDGYHVDLAATGTNENAAPTYQRFQCTWWAAIRRAQIGKPVDGHMGNGGQWGATASRLGYPMGGEPRPGDAISFHPGVHGSDPRYGHVAIVENVKSDGSIVISQSGTGWMAVVIETISRQQLDAMAGGIDFIH